MIKGLILYKSVSASDVILADVFLADTFRKRLIGYMFRKEPHYEAIVIKPCKSIHTFFMKFSIDVLFVNENMEIVKKIEGLKPGKVILPIKEATIVVESKAGILKSFKTGDKIVII